MASKPKPRKSANLTAQQERFCHEYVRLGVGSHAYRVAYRSNSKRMETAQVAASTLLSNAKIARRVEVLREKAMDDAGVSLKSLLLNLNQERAGALESRQYSAATGATMGMAKATGFLKDDPTKAGDIHLHFDGLMKGLL